MTATNKTAGGKTVVTINMLSLLSLTLLLLGCAESTPPAEPQTNAPLVSTPPPGFTDTPPPAPVSDTVILSGGILLTEPPITDSVIVITQGVITGWGRRGEMDIPNDSIGRDVRGLWIRETHTLVSGAIADLQVYDQYPTDPTIEAVGSVKSELITLPSKD
jgi:hypothetical protein